MFLMGQNEYRRSLRRCKMKRALLYLLAMVVISGCFLPDGPLYYHIRDLVTKHRLYEYEVERVTYCKDTFWDNIWCKTQYGTMNNTIWRRKMTDQEYKMLVDPRYEYRCRVGRSGVCIMP